MYFVRDENYTLPRGDLFKAETFEDCKKFLEKWSGGKGQWASDNLYIPERGNKHFITQIPKDLDECVVMRKLMTYEDAMHVFCRKVCDKCGYYKDEKCFIQEVFNNDSMFNEMRKEIMVV